MPHHNTPLTAPYRAALTHRWRSCTDHALSPRIACVVAVLFLFVGVAAQASAATYYVDPQAGSDTNDGASPSTAWKTVPGTRTQDNTGFLRTQWGAITQTNKVKCGDTILLKGGSTHSTTTVSGGGALRIGTNYYTNTCTSASPITIQVANSGQWSGSSGNFTIDGTGMRNTSAAYQAADGTCLNGGVCALIDIEGLDGVILAGASKSQRLALRTVNINTGGDQTVGILVQGKGAAAGRHIQLGYIDITGKTSYDKGAGLSITDVGLSWVHDVTVHDWTGTGVDTNLQTTSHRVQSVVFENVTVVNSGKTTAGTYPIAESYYLGGAEYSDARAGGGVWCLHCASGNGFADGLDAFGCTSGGTDGILKLRDSAWYGNGRNGIATMLFNGQESGGDHLGAGACTSGTGATLPEQTSVDIRSVFYNNAGYGLAAPHGGGSRYVWQSTFYRAGAGAVGQGAAVLVHIDSNSLGIFDSIIDNASSGLPIAMERGQGGSTSDGNRTAPVVKNTLIRGPATSATLASFDTMCTADNGATDTGQHCKNGSCPSGQTCRMTPINVNVTTTYGAGPGIPGFLNDTGNRVGVDDPKFVSTGGQCNTAFSLSTGAPGFTDCDFHLQSGSPAIDPPTPLFVLLANGAGTDSSTITVKASTPEPEQVLNPPIAGSNYASIDGSLAWGSRPHIADPRTYFVSPQNHPWATGDVIQIVGTCAHGASRRGAAGRAQIVSMTSSTITVDDTCTWADGAGVHWPYNGNAPDLGAYEFGLSNTGLAAPTLLSVDPVQP